MNAWFESQPSVFEEEKSALGALGFSLDEKLLAEARLVSFTGISKADTRRKLRITFPPGYPSFPPEVFDESGEPVLTRHHHPHHRGFCLFGPDRNRWISSMTADSAIAEVEELIRNYSPGVNVAMASEVPEPVSDLLTTVPVGGFLIPPEIATEMTKPTASTRVGKCELMITNNPKAPRRGVILSVELDGSQKKAPGFQRVLAGQTTEARSAMVVRLAETPPMITPQSGPSAWLNLVPTTNRKAAKGREEWLLFVYPEEAGRAENKGVGFTMVQVASTGWNCYRCYPLNPDGVFTRIPGLEPLADKKVVIIGLGALGSRIAVCLAASGIRKFFFLDHDIYDTANAVRHECGFASFGLPKVQAVAQRVLEMNPHSAIRMSTARVGSMNAEDEGELEKQVLEADLVVNATGSEHAAHWLDRRCQMLGKSCLHAAVANGAWSGEVIRVLPGRTPCWVCHQIGHDPLATAPRSPGGFFAAGCAHPTFTGSMPEVSIVAEMTAAMAIETLLDQAERDFSGSHIRWAARSLSGSWSPKVEVVTPKRRPECSICSPAAKSPVTSF